METFHPVALRSQASTSASQHSPVVVKAASEASQQLRASSSQASVETKSRKALPLRTTSVRSLFSSNAADRPVYGLQHLIDSYPSHPHNKAIKVLSAQQYYDLQAQDLALTTPESVLFPWLHGADQRGTNQACYFGYADKPCKTPRFRALTTVSADTERTFDDSLDQQSTTLRGKSYHSTSSISSISSSSSSASSFSSFDSTDSPTSSTSSRGAARKPAQLLSTFYPEDLLLNSTPGRFQEVAVPQHVNLRNFRLQATKLATVSDIVIFSASGLASPELLPVAERFLDAQKEVRQRRLQDSDSAEDLIEYYTFVIADSFDTFERFYPELIAVTLNGFARHKVDFFTREKEEMRILTQASQIADGVWLGNSEDVPMPTKQSLCADTDLDSLAAALEQPVQTRVDTSSIYRNRIVSSDSSSSLDKDEMEDGNANNFSICIEANDQAYMPDAETLKGIEDYLDKVSASVKPDEHLNPAQIVHLECISTGQACTQPGSAVSFIDNLVQLCMWIRRQAKPSSIPAPSSSSSGFSPLRGRKARAMAASANTRRPRNVLFHTGDGYTDTSVLALAYIMYDRACTLPQAYLHLQNDRQRSFFVYPADVILLTRVESRIAAVIAEERRVAEASSDMELDTPLPSPGILRGRFGRSSSPVTVTRPVSIPQPQSQTEKMIAAPFFYNERFDGHFPSRILPFLYLGNLNHATNALMLKELGITHVVSIGETALIPPRSPCESPAGGVPTHLKARIPTNSLWLEASLGNIEVLDMRGIADDGIDPIRDYIEQAEQFIEAARQKGGKVLVHCRVGVSRSASLVIAYVMKHLEMDLHSAYLLVRSRRLNILIQPTILFMWSLQWYEAKINQERRKAGLRPLGPRLTWGYLAREMTELNARYLSC